MKHWTFSHKVGISIAAASLAVVLVVSGFVYFTFRSWSESEELRLLETKLKQFSLQISNVSFLPSLLSPAGAAGTMDGGVSAVFKPDLSAFAGDLDEGQRLLLLGLNGQVLAEVGGTGEQADAQAVKYKAEKELSLPAFGSVKLELTDNGHTAGAAAQREISRLLLLGLLLAAVMSVAAGRIVTRSALRPIRNMISEVRSIEANDLSKRLHLPSARDELYQLGKTFNTFLQKLDVSFDQQKRFVADASHELKTPLAIIEGHTRMVQRWGKQSPKVLDESLAFMVEETQRMKELIAQLLLLAEAEEPLPEGSEEICELNDMLQKLLPQTVHINPNVYVAYERDPLGGAVRMPAAAVYQVLRNIVENALKYTPEGGQVNIRCELRGDRVIVSVADTGIGISPEQLPHIFDRFYRAESSRSRARGGSGLGLAIVKAIMERYGGAIRIESEPGQGTMVELYFIHG